MALVTMTGSSHAPVATCTRRRSISPLPARLTAARCAAIRDLHRHRSARSSPIREWSPVSELGIDTVIDLDAGLDECIPTTPEGCLYVYFPIYDENLPNLTRLDAVGTLGAQLIRGGHRVLSHCGLGFNRSALVAGVILHKLGMEGLEIVRRIRARRPGALFNELFADYLASL